MSHAHFLVFKWLHAFTVFSRVTAKFQMTTFPQKTPKTSEGNTVKQNQTTNCTQWLLMGKTVTQENLAKAGAYILFITFRQSGKKQPTSILVHSNPTMQFLQSSNNNIWDLPSLHILLSQLAFSVSLNKSHMSKTYVWHLNSILTTKPLGNSTEQQHFITEMLLKNRTENKHIHQVP